MEQEVVSEKEVASLEKASQKIAREVKSLRASLNKELQRAAKRRVKIVEAYNKHH